MTAKFKSREVLSVANGKLVGYTSQLELYVYPLDWRTMWMIGVFGYEFRMEKKIFAFLPGLRQDYTARHPAYLKRLDDLIRARECARKILITFE